MMTSRSHRWRLGLFAAALLAGLSGAAHAVPAAARATAEATECVGYHTIKLPGRFGYALTTGFDPRFSDFGDGLGAWGTEIRLDLIGLPPLELSISQPAGAAELKALIEARNKDQQKKKADLLESARWLDDNPGFARDIDPDGVNRKRDREEAARVPFYQAVPGRDAVYFADKGKLALHALVDGHVLSAEVTPPGPPDRTLDAFLGHHRPRAPGEVPSGPGVCVPQGFFTGEKRPATIGLNLRLREQPDIVVYLRATDAAGNPPDDPRKLLDGLAPVATFFGSRRVVPINRFKPLQAITIDGQEGLGGFVRVTRKTVADQDGAFNNAAENDEDWGYVAYVPGRSGGKPGESFNLDFKVERFGRFARRPMPEREFRDLALRIAASIKRRPGAWVVD